MKRTLRLVFSITALSGLAISQLPSSGNCQMIYGSAFAASCALPCCKSHVPMPKCPLLKVSAQRDLIVSSVPNLENSLQPMHAVGLSTLPAPYRIATWIATLVESIDLRLFAPAQSVRAPPTDVHLLAA